MTEDYGITKTKLANFFYNRKKNSLVENKIESFKFDEIKSIGIIFDNNHYGLQKLIDALIQEFRKKSGIISIFNLGYEIDEMNKPEANGIPVVYFNKKDLNWYGMPKYKDVTNFTDTKFDLLINLASEDSWAIKFCALLSKGKFKVSNHSGDQDIYDLMINTKEEKGEYISLMIDTLKIINK